MISAYLLNANQVLSIVHEMQSPLDCKLLTEAVFLDISKVFDKVWYQSPLFKLKPYGVEGNLFRLLKIR